MGETKPRSLAGQPDDLSDVLVALYLTEETGLPCTTKDYAISLLEVTDSAGARIERRALRVTFEKNTSVKQQRHLLTFGSDDHRCNVILNATEASPVHCKVYAQLNSGPHVWVIDDTSTDGTRYVDEESRLTGISKTVVGRRVAARGLCRLQIGRHIFTFWSPSDEQEISRRERWFQDLDPILVTESLLQEQLLGGVAEYRPIESVGHGGMGEVFKYMELTTGLMIAVKEEEVKKEGADQRIQKEIAYMQSLRHVSRMIYLKIHLLILCSQTWLSTSRAMQPYKRGSKPGSQLCHCTKDGYATYYLWRYRLLRRSCFNSLTASITCTDNGFYTKTSSPKTFSSKERYGQTSFWQIMEYARLSTTGPNSW